MRRNKRSVVLTTASWISFGIILFMVAIATLENVFS